MKRLQQIYDSEINYTISTFWDGGIRWSLGDKTNGVIDKGWGSTIDEAIEQLAKAVIKHYPESEFAKAQK